MKRRKTPVVKVGSVVLGGGHPVVIQSMTDTPTADIESTIRQTIELILAGAQMVRITVNDDAAAKAVPAIIKKVRQKGYDTPIIGDFHFNGHLLLAKYPQCARLLDKYRMNPGNIGKGIRKDENFSNLIQMAIKYKKPVRIGVNSGSLDQELLAQLMDRNAKRRKPKDAKAVMSEAMVQSALQSAVFAERLGLGKDKIILSAKMSNLQDMVAVNQRLAEESDYALHIGLTEAGSETQGITASAAALAILLQQGIGDTIRASLTPSPGINRTREVEVCKFILQSMGLAYFTPTVTSCPGCGRTSSQYFQKLARNINADIEGKLPIWRKKFPGIERLTIAVMGCVVNGPGESRHADIGISLPGTSERPAAPVYIEGKQTALLSGKNIEEQFVSILEKYIKRRFS